MSTFGWICALYIFSLLLLLFPFKATGCLGPHTHTHTPTPIFKKVKFFKPLPFPLNILLHFETDNTKPKRLLFEKIENISFVNVCVWTRVSPHSVSSSYTVWTSFVLRSTLLTLHKITRTYPQKCIPVETSIVFSFVA